MMSMKKTVLCLLLFSIILSLAACAHSRPTDMPIPKYMVIDATIEKVYDDTFYVCTTDETHTYFFVDRCEYITHNGERYDDGILLIGDHIRITYEGNPIGNSPAQITNVSEIVLISTLTEH